MWQWLFLPHWQQVHFSKRYAPSKEWMDGYKYFEVDSNTDKTFVIIDNKSYSDIGVMRDDVLYLPVDLCLII